MELRTDYLSASGSFWEGYCFLAHRYDPNVGFKRLESESIVVRKRVNLGQGGASSFTLELVLQTTARLVELWRSPSGTLFVADSWGRVLQSNMRDPEEHTPWTEAAVDAVLHGVWGLSDDLVFAFGSAKGGSAMFQWDGVRWSPAPAPSFEVEGMHGLSRDSIWAAGAGGKVAHWTGRGWQELKLPTDETILSIFVAKPGEYYACGNRGNVFEGSDDGWGGIGSIPGALQGDVQAVAKYADQLWVGASRLGLWQRKGESAEYVCLKPNIAAVSFDARKDLLIGAETMMAWTADGQKFKGEGGGYVATTREGFPLGSF